MAEGSGPTSGKPSPPAPPPPFGRWPGGARRQGKGERPAAPPLPAARRRAKGGTATAAPAGKAGRSASKRRTRGTWHGEPGTGKVFAAMIFDNCNDFQQPRLPVLTELGTAQRSLWALKAPHLACFEAGGLHPNSIFGRHRRGFAWRWPENSRGGARPQMNVWFPLDPTPNAWRRWTSTSARTIGPGQAVTAALLHSHPRSAAGRTRGTSVSP
jgi:hypothetical protein